MGLFKKIKNWLMPQSAGKASLASVDISTTETKAKTQEKSAAQYVQVGETQHLAGGAFAMNMVISEPTEQEKLISSLHKQATVAVKSKDFAEAIRCLETAQQLMAEAPGDYEVKRYLRLPNALQQAGRLSEAEAIFEDLLVTWQKSYEQAAIHSQMRIAYNREKRYDLAFLHGVQQVLWRCVNEAEHDCLPDEWKATEYWAPEIEKLLKRAKILDLQSAVLECLAPFLAKPSGDKVGSTIVKLKIFISDTN